MTNDSYTRGRMTGLSDGSTAGVRGADEYRAGQRHLARNSQLLQGQPAGTGDEGRKLGALLMAMVAGLFLHPYFCFVGFWLVGFALLLALPAYLPLPDATLAALEPWYAYFAAVLPLVLAWPLRKIIPRLMKWTFFIALAVFVISMIVNGIASR